MSSEDEFRPSNSNSDGNDVDSFDDQDTEWTDDSEPIGKKKISTSKQHLQRNRRQQLSSSKRQRADDGDELHYEQRFETWAMARKVLREKERAKTCTSDINEQKNKANSRKYQMYLPHPLFGESQISQELWLPGEIYTSLFEYQRICLQWLWKLHQQETGGILGDEMGLGKTVQIIAFLVSLLYSNQWKGPFNRWWPPMRTLVLHSSGSAMHTIEMDETSKRHNTFYNTSPASASSSSATTRMSMVAEQLVERVFKHGHVLLATYEGLRRFRKTLLRRKWYYAILDEGHKIRNPEAEITLACKQLDTPHRIIVTGTPIQNNLTELWSLFDFIYPGRLGTLDVFDSQFAMPINMGGYANASRLQVEIAYKCASILRDLIEPYLLKRTKAAVAKDLPKKTEHVVLCRLTTSQRQAYEAFLRSSDMNSIMRGDRRVLYGIDILKKICNHPDLLDVSPSRNKTFGQLEKSGKMRVLVMLLEQWQHEKTISEKNYEYRRMDGNTPIQTRASLIHEFNHSDNVFLFLLTTKVGGLGINLNPSTDVQARERAWRLGQKRDVAIYRLITAGTIEEKIYHRQIFKHYLSRKILNDPKQQRFFKMHDLQDLFTLGADDAVTTETGELFEGAAVLPPQWHKNKNNKAATKDNEAATEEENSEDANNYGEANEAADTPPTSSLTQLAISDIQGISEYTPGFGTAPDNQSAEDELLQQLFSMSGVKSIIKHDTIADANNQEASLIEKEAALIASHAAAALKEAGEEKVKRFGVTIKGKRGNAGPSSSALLNNLRQNNVSENKKQELSGLMKELQQYLVRQNGRAQSQQLVAAFQDKIKQGESLIFRKLLKEIADFERDDHSKTGWWHLKREYQ
ncbi:SNF2 family N-terminal domain-containing protein [Syncephalis fuscata]|nr:SNF2 family N-terminal domain-containing protein [Syncephalis fuscata]